MPALRGRHHLAACLGYVCVAIVFAWPLPLQLHTSVPGPVGGDTGVYIWNLWVFRHEVLSGRFPFFTNEILSVTPALPLTLHNYTTFANVLAFPVLPIAGTVATFNLLLMVSGALAAYTMFLFARRVSGDGPAAWVAGLLFGFSPYMSARFTEHFSLLLAAPLPVFALLLDRLRTAPSRRLAIAAGAVIAWAFLCDPYYAVYCLLMAAFAAAYATVSLQVGVRPRVAIAWRALLDFSLICLAGLIAGIVIRGGGRLELFGIGVSVRHLYTPVLMFTVLATVRLWMVLRPRVTWQMPLLRPHVQLAAAAVFGCVLLLSPVLSAMGGSLGQRSWVSPKIFWRSSASGADLLAFFVPNPMNVLWGGYFRRGLAQMPDGFVENVASIPWVAIALLVLAVAWARTRLTRYWVVFTALFGVLALGPFIEIAGMNTYIPTPWALLRYVPIVGAARMPTRFSVLVIFGVAVLVALALRDLRQRWKRPAMATAVAAALLLVELVPAPRPMHTARVSPLYDVIAADPRPIRVLQLPFGLRDGVSSAGNYSAEYQFYQTAHHKQLIGGYVSRLPQNEVERYRRIRLFRTLIDLSAGEEVSEGRLARTAVTANQMLRSLEVGYVVINTTRCTPQLVDFATSVFDMTYVGTDGPLTLYRTNVLR